jgi:preprotein translocase subunit YajC
MMHCFCAIAQGSSQGLIIALVLAMVAYMVIASTFGRKEKKQRQQLLDNLKKNDRVMTIGGIVGSVVSTTPEEVVLKVDESANVKITFVRSAIKTVLTEGAKTADLK